VRRSYDAVGRLACEYQLLRRWTTLDTTNVQTRLGIKYFYDADGRLTTRWFGHANWQTPPAVRPQDACNFGGADSARIGLHYDAHQRVDSLTGWNLKADSTIGFRFAFDAAGRRDTVRNSRNSWQQTFSYNEDDFLNSDTAQDLLHLDPLRWQAITDNFSLRDDAGRVLTKSTYESPSYTFTYDPLGEVTLEAGRAYAYDSSGAGQVLVQPGAVYTYDTPSGRITQLAGVGPSNPEPGDTMFHRYAYDQAGDRTADTVFWRQIRSCFSYPELTLTSYDGAGRPAGMRKYPYAGIDPGCYQAQVQPHWWTYWYDALGRRVVVADSDAALSKPLQRFFYDGDDVLISTAAFWQQGGGVDNTGVSVHGTQEDSYIHDVTGVDRPLYWVASYSALTNCGNDANNHVNELFFISDERGNIRSTAYNAGHQCSVSGYDYTGYGQFTSGATLSNSQPGFAGAPSDASGLVFMRNRSYDPNTGTFTQADPIGLAGGLNLYGYAGNNPITFTDPFGLCPVPPDDCPLGSQAGQDATEHWANVAATSSSGLARAGATAMGLLSALWTPETATRTGVVLASAGVSALAAPAVAAAPEAEGGGAAAKAVAGRITGYTEHGLDQAISREGTGVSPRAILDAVRNPSQVVEQAGGAMKYIGDKATVILNEAGKVITTWARSSAGWRIPP